MNYTPSFMTPQLQLFDSRSLADRWTVRVSGRARRLSVRVYPGGRVEVVVPPGASPAAVQKFVGTHRQWIHRRVADLSTAAAVDRLELAGDPQRPEVAAIVRQGVPDQRVHRIVDPLEPGHPGDLALVADHPGV